MIEPDEHDAYVTQAMLREGSPCGFEVVHVASSSEVDRVLRSFCPDIVVSEPFPSGVEPAGLSDLVERVPYVPVVAFTGCEVADFAVNAIEAGAQDVLVKGETDEVALCRALRFAIARKRAEVRRQLQEEQDLNDFFENAPVGIHWVDSTGRIIKINRAELEMLGYGREEVLGRHISAFHADPEVASNLLARLIRGKVLYEYPALLRCKDGSTREVLIDSNVLWEGRAFLHTRCIVRDVTDRRIADRSARLEQALLSSLSHAPRVTKMGEAIIESICQILDWEAGALWCVDGESGLLRCVSQWHRSHMNLAGFSRMTHDLVLRRGEGLPGRVWESGKPCWIDDVLADQGFSRRTPASVAGLRAGLAFPVKSGSEVVGVFEFFAGSLREMDTQLFLSMAVLGSHMAQIIELERTRRARQPARRAAQTASLGEG